MIGIHVSLWTPEWDAPVAPHVRQAAGLGFDAVEIPIMDPGAFPLDDVRRVLDDTGLAVFCGTGLGPDTDISSPDPERRAAGKKHLEGCLEICRILGSPSLQGVIHSAWGKRDPVGEKDRDASAAVLKDLARQAGESGRHLSLECINRYESSFLNTVDQGLDLLRRIGEDNVGLHLDTYHMNIEETDMAGAMSRAGDRLTHLHLSENQRGFPGSGALDWPGLIDAADRAGYRGPWIIESYIFPEFPAGRDVSIWRTIEPDGEASLRRSLAMLRERIG